MIDAPAATPPTPRYRLATFGTLALLGPADDTILGGHGHHRRRLALLAVLAAAGERGRSRDQLVTLFWPEATQARARHSLDQLLYSLRSTLGESLFQTGDPVRLNSAVLGSDVETLNHALERNDLEAAVALHRGPFLDGFHLGDLLEFERWLESERARLEQRYTTALQHLAERAEARGDFAAAVIWRRRCVEVDPLSGANAVALIRALKNAGDHAAALQYAERYEAVVAQELDTSVGPEVASIVAQVRAEAVSPPLSATRSATVRAEGTRQSSVASPRPLESPAADQPAPRLQPHPPRRLSPLVALAMLVLAAVAIVATVAGLRAAMRQPAAPMTAEPSIAVLPFTSVGGGSQDSVLVDGISDELIRALSRIEHVRVLARNSTFALRNSGVATRRIADSLGASYVVEGSVRWSAPRLQIQARLLDATGATRWSETYDRERTDVFLVQSDIAAAVAHEIGRTIDVGAIRALRQGPTKNIAAYELYLRGRDPVNFRSETDSGPLRGLALLQQAVALDPTFAAAYANMPYMYAVLVAGAPDVAHARAYKRLADSMARRAVMLDPLLPEAYGALGVANVAGLSDLRAAEAAFRRSIALGGSPRVHELLANVLALTGRPEEALAETIRSAREDPLSATATAELGKAFCLNHRYDEGLAELARVTSVRPPLLRVAGHAALCYGMQGKWREAAAQLRDRRRGRLAPLLGYTLARSGDTAEARKIRDELVERWGKTQRGAYGVAIVSAGLEDYDQAFVWLDRAVDDLSLEGTVLYPMFSELHADPRFARFLDRLGLQKPSAMAATRARDGDLW